MNFISVVIIICPVLILLYFVYVIGEILRTLISIEDNIYNIEDKIEILFKTTKETKEKDGR